MVFDLSFILEFTSLFVTLFRSFSLTNINIPFIENSTILKRSSAFFASFFTQNITHFIFHFIKLSQQKKAKTQPFWAAITLLFLPITPPILHQQFCNLFAIKQPLLGHSSPLFALKRLIIQLYLCFRGKKTYFCIRLFITLLLFINNE